MRCPICHEDNHRHEDLFGAVWCAIQRMHEAENMLEAAPAMKQRIEAFDRAVKDVDRAIAWECRQAVRRAKAKKGGGG